MSLRTRVGLFVFVMVILGVGLAVGGGFSLAERELHEEVDHSLDRRAAALTDTVEDPSEPAPRHQSGDRPLIGAITLAEFDGFVQVLDANGRPVSANSDLRLPVTAADRQLASEGGNPIRRTVHLHGHRYRMLTAPFAGGGAVQVVRDLGETDRALRGLLRRIIPLGALVAAVAGAAARLLARRALKPVEELTRTAARVAQTQDLGGMIEVRTDDEVGRLARSFNTMLEALQTSRLQQRRLVADAGHELRTPLTSMRTNIELLQRVDSLDDAERERTLGDVNAELRELGELVRELVELAGDTGAGDEPWTAIDLADLAEDAAERARRRTNRDITTEAESGGTIQGQRGSLERAVDNLVGNATKFSPEDTPIRIVTGGGRLEVHDSGTGIATEDQPLVFERFFRSATARAQPGSGLGLAIVKQIVERHGGHVWAGTSPNGGAAVGFELPPVEQ